MQKKAVEEMLNDCMDILALSNCTVEMKGQGDDERVFTVYRNGTDVGEYPPNPIGSVEVDSVSKDVPVVSDQVVENTIEEAKAEPWQDLKKHEVKDSDDDMDGTVASDLDNEDTFQNDRQDKDEKEPTQCMKAWPNVTANLKGTSSIQMRRDQKQLRKQQQNYKTIPDIANPDQTPLQQGYTNRPFKNRKTPQGDGNFIIYREAVEITKKKAPTLKQTLAQRPKNLAYTWKRRRPVGESELSIGVPMCTILD